MNRIFISYRRADIPYALLVYNQLSATFGGDSVFRDIEDIAPGEDFAARIRAALDECRAVVALVGKGWVRQRARLARRGDFVRLELLLALERGVPIFPITVGGARVPGELPPPLRRFAKLNAIPVTDYRFPSDFDTVVAMLRKIVRPTAPRRGARGKPTSVLTEEVNALQLRAVGLVEQGEIAAAQRSLDRGWKKLMTLRAAHEPDAQFQLALGYLHKTIAQALEAAGKRPAADGHMALAASSFAYVEREAQEGLVATADLAGALNGLGNVHSFRGESQQAIACYRKAVAILPGYAYAWHDLLLELLAAARRGPHDAAAMKQALEQLRAAGGGVAGIDAARIAWFEREVSAVSARASTRAKPAAAAARTARG
jgi:tetratricopeptide (TPR) repeat protein